MNTLDFGTLREAIRASHVAIRCRIELRPADGVNDKVFPFSFTPSVGSPTRYATEAYVDDGVEKLSVLLDSVASSTSRHHLALQEGLASGEITFPNPYVDFTVDEELVDIGRVTALQAPYGLADAIFGDSMLDGTLFWLSELGRRITDATPNSATALLLTNPVALLMGMWDSTDPKGGVGSKFERAFVSEIVGLGARLGAKVADSSNQSGAHHESIASSIDHLVGEITIEKAIQTTVISLAALRKLHFPTDASGAALTGSARIRVEIAARTAIAALGVAAIAHQRDFECDLRSRCLLVPTQEAHMELVPRDDSTPPVFTIDRKAANKVLEEAARECTKAGLAWPVDEIRLVPAPKLCELIKRSRAQSRQSPTSGQGE